MDPTQRFDPNKTQLSGAPSLQDPLKTQAMGAFDPLKTQAMTGFTAPQTEALTAEIIPGRDATMANGPAREQFLLELKGAGGNFAPGVGMGGGGSSRTPL